MEKKTKVVAEEGRQDLHITRDFDLPVDLLFRAYTDADLVAQWMGTRVLKLESRTHGSYQFETSNAEGKVAFRGSGVIHTLTPDVQIVRTFEMEGAGFGPTIEYLEFTRLSEDTSRLEMHVVYRTGGLRDANLKMPFSYGINMAHDRLQQIVRPLK